MMWLGAILLVGGLVALGYLVIANPKSGLRRSLAQYEAAVDRILRFLLVKTPAKRLVRTQIGVGVGFGLFFFLFGQPLYALVAVMISALLPWLILSSRRQERTKQLEAGLDKWLLLLANSLKATPSLGEAFGATAKLMRAPWSEELDLLLKEIQLGTPVDQAVTNMAARIDSRIISGAMSSILIGRQTGGDLTRILEESATSLREANRLDGVVRAKTAEGKGQAFVLGVMPFVLLVAVYQVDPNWMAPLTQTALGYTVLLVATGLWLSAIVIARKVLAVDI